MSNKSRINKQPTSSVERSPQEEYDITGNVRRRGEDPSPADRERGERSSAEPAAPTDAGRR